MAECHQYAPEDDRIAAAEYSIADQPSEYRREVDQANIEAKSLRGEPFNCKRSRDRFQNMPIGPEANNLFDVPRQQQLLGHVKREQRDHAMERNSLPQLRAC